ncbi:LysR substrate-binding domain-containing protein [Rhizobium redzepovicii]|uniref:LysR substrate-binding domain-containing protein n=1 Tax=Rhizobium sp. C104 TaxID=2917727 RepID=UPI0031BBAED0
MAPGSDLQILTNGALVDFSRDGVDLAVRHGVGRYPGLRSYRVVSVEMVPVAAPSLVEHLGMPELSDELTRWPQVHDADRKGWSLWFQAQGIDEIEVPRGPSFNDSSLLLSAVIAGQGAGLLPAAMVALDVNEGRLVKLAKPTHMETFAYYLVYPEEKHSNLKVSALRDWILGAAST